MSYRKVKSQIIKRLMQNASWENYAERNHIDALCKLETLILKRTREISDDELTYGFLKLKHSWEWAVIYQELNPEEFERVKKSQRLEDAELEKHMEESMKESEGKEKRLKQEWLEMGGKE